MVSYGFVPNPASLKPRTSFRCQPSLPVAPVIHQCKTSHWKTCAVWIRETVAKIFILRNLHTEIEYVFFSFVFWQIYLVRIIFRVVLNCELHVLWNMYEIIGHLISEFQPSVNPTVIPQEATVNGQGSAGNTNTLKFSQLYRASWYYQSLLFTNWCTIELF